MNFNKKILTKTFFNLHNLHEILGKNTECQMSLEVNCELLRMSTSFFLTHMLHETLPQAFPISRAY